MKSHTKHGVNRLLALLLVLVLCMNLAPAVFAAQPATYRDPAEHWMDAGSRTNELDVNAVVSHETFYCSNCAMHTAFTVWRTPEYTRDGQTALSRNVYYSDGTMIDGENTGTILDGDPGIDAYYTGYHWTKSMCENCGTVNSNASISEYGFGKNVYYLYDCAAGFSEELDEVERYAYADDTYHTKTVDGGHYCEFCFGTVHTHSSSLERHALTRSVEPQIAHNRFVVTDRCALCDYEKISYVTAKSVVADYYGTVDGQAHTLTLTDLSDSGVSTAIRYGNSADSCTLTTAPSYTAEGQYTVFYAATYSYGGESMTENGVAYVWLRDESAGACACGCGDMDCACADSSCNGSCHSGACGADHRFAYLDTVAPTCIGLGYDRYVCADCGAVEKRNYTNALDHAYSGVVVSEASCAHEGKLLEICARCGDVKVTAAPKGEHQYQTYSVAATCTASGYTVRECDTCGERAITSMTEAKGHSYVSRIYAPTCTTGGHTMHICSDCGDGYIDSYTEATGHHWDAGTVIRDATCTENGVIEYRCAVCDATSLKDYDGSEDSDGHIHSRSTAVTLPSVSLAGAPVSTLSAAVNTAASGGTGHTYIGSVTPPTCTERGFTTYVCVTCGDSYVSDFTAALDHNFRAEITPPTCTELGYTTYTCAHCGDSFRGDYIAPTGHSYKAVVTAPTCTERGYTIYICDRCGDSYVGNATAALGHDWKAPVILASNTCNGDGVLEYDCSRCDAHYHEAISATGHNPGPAADCINPQTCLDCGAVLAPATSHNYKATVIAPTCIELGYTTYICASCGDSYKSDYVRELGHHYLATVTPATCTEGGYTTYTCTRCGDSYVDDYTDPMGHDWKAPVILASNTCNSDGVLEYDCSRCDAHYHEAISATGHNPGPSADCIHPQTCLDCGAVLAPATGHNYKATVTPATCAKMGYTTFICVDCGESYRSDYTEPLGHDYVVVVTAPTCTEHGYTTYTCSRSGESYQDDFTAPVGHRLDGGKILTSAACAHDGVIQYRCLDCDFTVLGTIPATGHNPGPEATCTDPQLCLDCGVILAPATGHSLHSEIVPATCLDLGHTHYFCGDCGIAYDSDYTLPVGHDYLPTVTAPTCTEAGYMTYTCSRCGDSYISDHIEVLGHEWDAGTQIVGATCNGAGVLGHKCLRCGEHYLEALSPAGHTPGSEATCADPQLCTICGAVLEQAHGHNYESTVTAPTCTELGYTTYTCADCGDSYKSDYVEAAGHKPGDWIIDKQPTTAADGSKHRECEICHETLETERIEKLYLSAVTDMKGEATVGEYLVTVTDTETKLPVHNATVTLNGDGSITVRLPDGRLLDYAAQTTVTVLKNTEEKTAVSDLTLTVTDNNGNAVTNITNVKGQLSAPALSGATDSNGKRTIGYVDGKGKRQTVTVLLCHDGTGRPIIGAGLSFARDGKLVVVLPDGVDLDDNNRISIVVTDNEKRPVNNVDVTARNDLNNTANGATGADGALTLPEIVVTVKEKHGAYIKGYPDGTFGPGNNMTRSEAAAIFARLLAEKNGDDIPVYGRSKFADVPADAWYAGYVAYLTRYGVIYGTSETIFSPDREITRGEFVTMAVRFYDATGGSVEAVRYNTVFSDVQRTDWAVEYIREAAARGWIVGYADGSFRPGNNITRAEVVTVVNRLLGRAADSAYIDANLRYLNTFADMTKTHWAYYAVMEAANRHTAVLDGGETWSK